MRVDPIISAKHVPLHLHAIKDSGKICILVFVELQSLALTRAIAITNIIVIIFMN